MNRYASEGWEVSNIIVGTSNNSSIASIHGIVFKKFVKKLNKIPDSESRCNRCGTRIRSEDKFCFECGEKI